MTMHINEPVRVVRGKHKGKHGRVTTLHSMEETTLMGKAGSRYQGWIEFGDGDSDWVYERNMEGVK